MIFLFFFFKQKTAYEVRISDWSSDVCSSDLDAFGTQRALELAAEIRNIRQIDAIRHRDSVLDHHMQAGAPESHADLELQRLPRSEEHTSELQSLMRISYAVFCLKKKKINDTQHQKNTILKKTHNNNQQ